MEGKLLTQKYIDAVTAWERKFDPYLKEDYAYCIRTSINQCGGFDYVCAAYVNEQIAAEAYEEAAKTLFSVSRVYNKVYIPYGESHESMVNGQDLDWETWNRMRSFADKDHPDYWPGYNRNRVGLLGTGVRVHPW